MKQGGKRGEGGKGPVLQSLLNRHLKVEHMCRANSACWALPVYTNRCSVLWKKDLSAEALRRGLLGNVQRLQPESTLGLFFMVVDVSEPTLLIELVFSLTV